MNYTSTNTQLIHPISSICYVFVLTNDGTNSNNRPNLNINTHSNSNQKIHHSPPVKSHDVGGGNEHIKSSLSVITIYLALTNHLLH